MRLSIRIAAFIVIVGFLGIKALEHSMINVKAIINEASGKWATSDIQNIYRKVCMASGQCAEVPPLTIVASEQINAYATQNGIVIFSGLLEKMGNEDEVAIVLGHEISHFLLGHVSSIEQPTSAQIRVMEMQADKYGAFIIMRAGYDVCKGREIMAKFLNLFGDNMDQDHPDFAFRYNQINVNCEGGL